MMVGSRFDLDGRDLAREPAESAQRRVVVEFRGSGPGVRPPSRYSGTNSDGLVYYTCLRATRPGAMPSKRVARRTVACGNPPPPSNSGVDAQLEWACGYQEPSTC